MVFYNLLICFDFFRFSHESQAVIHHGGAGTTDKGLRLGLPTFVCPFFADQYFWAKQVSHAQVGPSPCPVSKLTSDILAKKLKELTSESLKENAVKLSEKMQKEDGVREGLQHFLDYLPVDNYCSDVNLILGESRLARFRVQNTEIKVGFEVGARLVPVPGRPKTFREYLQVPADICPRLCKKRHQRWIYRHAVTVHALGNPQTLQRGLGAGCFYCLTNIILSPWYCCQALDRFARSYGIIGCLLGVLFAPLYTIWGVLYGLFVFWDRLIVGFMNECFGTRLLYAVDRSIQYKLYNPWSIPEELQNVPRPSDNRKAVIDEAFDIATAASSVFEKARLRFTDENKQWEVAPAESLRSKVGDLSVLHDSELAVLMQLLKNEGKNKISFSRFSLFIGRAVRNRFRSKRESSVNVTDIPSFKDFYGNTDSELTPLLHDK